MASPYLVEFLFRGRAPGSDEASGYHVILGQDTVDPFTGTTTTVISPAMTPERAKEMGFDITAIVAAIDASIMSDLDQAKAAVATAQATIADLTKQLAVVQGKLDAMTKSPEGEVPASG